MTNCLLVRTRHSPRRFTLSFVIFGDDPKRPLDRFASAQIYRRDGNRLFQCNRWDATIICLSDRALSTTARIAPRRPAPSTAGMGAPARGPAENCTEALALIPGVSNRECSLSFVVEGLRPSRGRRRLPRPRGGGRRCGFRISLPQSSFEGEASRAVIAALD
jgi:hypothetical protein